MPAPATIIMVEAHPDSLAARLREVVDEIESGQDGHLTLVRSDGDPAEITFCIDPDMADDLVPELLTNG